MKFVMGGIPIDIMINITDPPTFAVAFNGGVEETQMDESRRSGIAAVRS